ncbi:hypothetical protein BCF33_0102 [Hasllibacter halocynthiae]|uniref:Uncharacterized protein n=2 Tax=Hasllibacter halocynthiae TaxID=595589 RepID=A0A2T0X6D0_9RHOB|nr:hypothetical protein BCF33_0102 [Hasllibacter halocynthiae]
MGWKMILAVAALWAGGLSALPVAAQGLRLAGPPAELPPSSFEGRQYIDSRGCIYVRAGFEGAESWVPRVGRDRRQLCGARPTVSDAGMQAVAPGAGLPAAGPLPDPAALSGGCLGPAGAHAPTRGCGAVDGAAALPAAQYDAVSDDIPVGDERLASDGAIRRVLAGTVIADTSRGPIRVRIGAERALAGAQPVVVPGGLVVPRIVARPEAVAPVAIPPGYRAVAFDDGRLNPDRGPRSIAGSFAAQLTWTNTTPRRLRSPLRSEQLTPAYRRVLAGH